MSLGPDPELKRQKPPNCLLDLSMKQVFPITIHHTLVIASVCLKNTLCTSQDIFAMHPSSFRFLFANSKDVFLISLPPRAFSVLLCRVCNHTGTHLERSFFFFFLYWRQQGLLGGQGAGCGFVLGPQSLSAHHSTKPFFDLGSESGRKRGRS